MANSHFDVQLTSKAVLRKAKFVIINTKVPAPSLHKSEGLGQGTLGRTTEAAYFALEKSFTANSRPLRAAMPPAESMSVSRMLARGWGRLHEVLVDGGGVLSFVHVFGVTGVGGVRQFPGLERREAWAPGRKQIPRFTRNDKREGGGRGDCFCPMAGSRFLVSLGMTNGRVVAGGIASVRRQEADSSLRSE